MTEREIEEEIIEEIEEEKEEIDAEAVEDEKASGEISVVKDNCGMGVVEVLLIMVVLIAMVTIFRNQIKDLVTNIWGAINRGASSICS